MNRVIVSARAEADLAAASQWYEHERVGLGAEYLSIIDATLATLGRSPVAFRKRYGEMRMALTPRFPFMVCFVWNEADEFISVLRILHVKRDLSSLLPVSR